ncbi:MAG: transposase [Verrucomicrobiales bacterium]|nr:transposase [Verrucomicrobiales bacterium]
MPEEENMPIRKYPANQAWRSSLNHPAIVFVTVCTKGRRLLLATEAAHELLVSCWKEADLWRVGRYVILPDHIHMFVSPSGRDSPIVKAWVKYWKSQVSRRWPNAEQKPIWQRDVWDRQLRTSDSYQRKWNYVRSNPVRHELVERECDWPFQGELNKLDWYQ